MHPAHRLGAVQGCGLELLPPIILPNSLTLTSLVRHCPPAFSPHRSPAPPPHVTAWAPLTPTVGPYAGLVLVAVLLQELARVGVWRFHRSAPPPYGLPPTPAWQPAGVAGVLPHRSRRRHATRCTLARVLRLSVRVLDAIARREGDAPLSAADHFGLALTHGLAHGATHSAFLFLAWLPLVLGDGTLYAAACPAMSFYLVGALSTLGMAATLAGGTVLALEGLGRRELRPAAGAAALHAAAALLTLANFAHNGCLVTTPLLLALGGGTAAAAGRLWWRQTGQMPRLAGAAVTAGR